MPNAGGAGFYRFALDEGGWRALTAHLDRLDEPGTGGADSLAATYQADRLSTEAYLRRSRRWRSRNPQVAWDDDQLVPARPPRTGRAATRWPG